MRNVLISSVQCALSAVTQSALELSDSQISYSCASVRAQKADLYLNRASPFVEAIVLSYKSLYLDPLDKLHAHSTRGVSSSWALQKGVSVEDICKAASWSSRHTFI